MFDLKHRPKKFSQVLGNSGVIKLLLSRSRSKTLSEQSMLFGGPKGCGKTTLARIVASSILCTSLLDGEPCGTCISCEGVLNETSNEFEELDAASQGTVDRIRSMIRDTDYDGGVKIYLLDEAQRLTAQAQDAMLKAMENRLLTFILCTTEPHKIKSTIRSRTEEYPINAPTEDSLYARLQEICKAESIEFEFEALKVIIRIQDGCPRTCIRALSTLGTLGPITVASTHSFFRFDHYSAVDKFLCLLDKDASKAFAVLDSLTSMESPSWIRDQIVAAIASAMRYDIGAKPTYPVSTHFFESRLHGWLALSKLLSAIDKPTVSDIECAILSSGSIKSVSPAIHAESDIKNIDSLLTSHTGKVQDGIKNLERPVIESPPNLKKEPLEVVPVKEMVPIAPASLKVIPGARNLEVDGVNFSPEEHLTSLDHKIEHGSKPPELPPRSEPVEFMGDNIPIPDKEFARGLIGRVIKGSQ